MVFYRREPGDYIEHVAPDDSDVRHGDQPGGALGAELIVVMSAHGRAIRAGGTVRITLPAIPTDTQVDRATADAVRHNFLLERAPGDAKSFLVSVTADDEAYLRSETD